jgi:asparagine synthase (glutamine-hydrolysing)
MNSIKGQFTKGTLVSEGKCLTYKDDHLEVSFIGQIYLKNADQNPPYNPVKIIAEQFERSGIDCFRELDGTYLVIIHKDGKYYLNRDRFGSGPQLFYNIDSFATSINDLVELTGIQKNPDLESIAGFLQFGYIPAPATALKGVSKLPCGQVLSWNGSGVSLIDLYPWSDYQAKEITANLTLEDAVDNYNQLHKKAILKRIANAGSVGVLLSGGYDSCGNIAALRKVYDGKVLSFTVGFKDNPWSEVPLAKKMAETFGAEFHHSDIDGSEINNLPELVRQMGDPFQEGGLMVNFSAMKLASGYPVDVVLGGDGNDQHHGTSGKELAMHLLASKTGMGLAQKILYQYEQSRTNLSDDKAFRIAFHNRKILNILYNDAFGFGKGELGAMGLKNINVNRYGIPSTVNSARNFNELYYQHNYFVDVKQVINEVILFKAGQNASLRNINIAFPYMDQEISSFLSTLPRKLRFSGTFKEILKGQGKSKFVHKKLYFNDLPKEVSTKKKQGGFAPLTIFFKSGENLDLVSKVILNSGICKSLLNENWVNEFIHRFKASNSSTPYWFWYSQLNAFRLFNLLVLAVWWETMINGKKADQLTELL